MSLRHLAIIRTDTEHLDHLVVDLQGALSADERTPVF